MQRNGGEAVTRYFINAAELTACSVWTEEEDAFTESFVESLIDNGYVECGWWRYQWYKWWKAR